MDENLGCAHRRTAGLCRNHLLGGHGELHAVWSVIVNGRKGYSRHPEVLRWRGRLKAPLPEA